MRSSWLASGIVAVIALAVPCMGQTVLYVNQQASPGGDGESWGSAFQFLQDALHTARQEEQYPTQIWVAQGSYAPDAAEFAPVQPESPDSTFLITAGIEVFGGFAGNEEGLEERNWEENLTVLDGLLFDDPQQFGPPIYAYHVVTIDPFVFLKEEESFPGSPRLDGVWITNGRAFGGDFLSSRGGGLHVNNPSLSPGEHNSPVVANCAFINNGSIAGCGGGVYVGSGNVLFQNCTFTSNVASGGPGAGVCVEAFAVEGDQGVPAVTLENCTWLENIAEGFNGSPDGGSLWAGSDTDVTLIGGSFGSNVSDGDGGAIANNGSMSVYDVTFELNESFNSGGAIRNGGFLTIDRSTFAYNLASSGGAISSDGPTLTISNSLIRSNGAVSGGGGIGGTGLNIINCTFVDNFTKISLGDAISGDGSMINSIVWASGFQAAIQGDWSVNYSAIEGGFPGDGNISDNPDFVNPDADDYRLNSGSPCIDAGLNVAALEGLPLDLDGNPRIVDGNGDGTAVVDMGAYETAEMAEPPVPTWAVAADGDFLDPNNWVEGLLPGFGDNIVFGAAPSNQVFTVSIPNGAPSPGSVFITNQRPTFNLSDIGWFEITGSLSVGTEGDPAELIVTNGDLEVWESVLVGGLGSPGILTLTASGHISSFGSDIAVEGSGLLRGSGSLSAWEGAVVNRGTVSPGLAAPGAAIGALSVSGGFEQESSGTLQVQLASTTSHDQLEIEGWAQLGGTLVVSLADGFEPGLGDSFTVVTSGSLSSPFHSHYMPALLPGLVMTVEYVDLPMGPPSGTSGSGAGVVLNVGTLEDLIGFGSPETFAAGTGLPAGLEISDLNGNGRQDIVVLLRSSDPTMPGSVVVLLNQGGGTTFSSIQFPAGLDPSDLVVADLNGSGAMDIAVVNAADSNVMIWENDGNAIFSVIPTVLPVDGSPVGIDAGDFRGIGVRDLAVVTVDPNSLVEVQNDGQGTFVALAPIPLAFPPVTVVAADLNMDGFTDVVVGDEAGQVMIFLSTAGGGGAAGLASVLPADPNQTKLTGRQIMALGVEDVDNNKDPDIIVTGVSQSETAAAGANDSGALSVFLNDGSGQNFTDALSVEFEGAPGELSLWDINGTGAADVAVVIDDPNLGGRAIRVFRNDFDPLTGILVFSLEQDAFGVGKEPVFVRNGDMNNSGISDMVALNASGAVGGAAGEPEASVAIWLNQSGDGFDPDGTCAGQCGGQGSSACWCDAACAELGDCCADFCDYCAEVNHDLCPLPGGEGCGLGFWKQQHHWGHWAGFSVSEHFCDIFDCSTEGAQTALGGKTLVQVLNLGARGLNGLGRQAVAALLNASSTVSYDLSVGQVIQSVDGAIALNHPPTINALMVELDGLNNQGCPISGHAPADMNHDGAVNIFDLMILLSHWGAVGPGDFSQTGSVDVFDLLYMLSAWGPVPPQ